MHVSGAEDMQINCVKYPQHFYNYDWNGLQENSFILTYVF